jgi:hypothetical protein
MNQVKALWILAFVTALTACAQPMVRPAPFRLRPDSVESGDLRGPFDGRVLDADTDRPVVGAQVYASWSFVDGYGLTAPAAWHEHLTVTDATGRYAIPRLGHLPVGGSLRLSDFHLVIYKRGYVAYRSDRRFDDFGPRTDFTQEHHEVRLERWRSDISHVKHLRYIGGGATLAELTKWEVADAAAELAGHGGGGEEPQQVATTTQPEHQEPKPPAIPNLDAKKFLTPDDVVAVTGYTGQFDVGDLGDEPASPEYDSVHLRARGQPESYDVAARVWKLDPKEAEAHFGRLLTELPHVKATNDVGDKSLRAAQNDILGAAFLDAKNGIVVLVQCGASQCKSDQQVVDIEKKVKDHIDALYPATPVEPVQVKP